MNFKRYKKPCQGSTYTEFIGEPVIYDGFLFPRYPSMFYFADGQPGRRNMFISNESNGFTISFEEDTGCMDERLQSETSIIKYISSEYQSGDRYIHQLRTDPATRPGAGNYGFFHMKIPSESGNIHILPGQFHAPNGYQWSDGVEPILIDLMGGMAVCKTKGGG